MHNSTFSKQCYNNIYYQNVSTIYVYVSSFTVKSYRDFRDLNVTYTYHSRERPSEYHSFFLFLEIDFSSI